MRRHSITALGAAIIAIAGIGIGTAAGAATSAKGVKACVTSKGVLQVATAQGKCPKHTTNVTIAKQGPRGKPGAKGKPGNDGKPGPGAQHLSLDAKSVQLTQSINFPAGDTLSLKCDGTATAGVATYTFTPAGDSSAKSVNYGTVDVENASGQFTENEVTWSVGHHYFANTNLTGAWTMTFTSTTSVTTMTAHLVVISGASSYVVDLAAADPTANECLGAAEVTPSS